MQSLYDNSSTHNPFRRFVTPAVALAAVVFLLYHTTPLGSSSRQAISSWQSAYTSLPDAPDLSQRIQTARTQYRYPSQDGNGTLCVIVRTYDAQAAYLPVFLMSLAQTNIPTRAYLVNTGSDRTVSPALRQASEVVNAVIGDPAWSQWVEFAPDPEQDTPPIELDENGFSIPVAGVKADWGFGLTDRMLQHLYKTGYDEHGCSHVMMTNGDNLYVHDLQSHVAEALLDQNVDVMAFDFISRYRRENPLVIVNRNLRIVNPGSYKRLEANFAVGRIDLGAAIFRYEFLRKNGLLIRDFGAYNNLADGYFIAGASALAKELYLTRAVMFIHQ